MAVRVLTLVIYLIYALDATEDINLTQFFIFMSIWFYNLSTFDVHYCSSSSHCELSKLPLFHVSPSVKKCPWARCTAEANSACTKFDVLTRQIITLSQTKYYFLRRNSPWCIRASTSYRLPTLVEILCKMVFYQSHTPFIIVLSVLFGQHVSTRYWVIIRLLHKNTDP